MEEEEKKQSETTVESESAQPDVETSAEASTEEVVVSPYKNKLLRGLDNFYGITKNKSKFKTEIFAGIATFLAMCYILVVNPNQLFYDGSANVLWPSVFLATAFGAVIGTLLMSLVAKMPYAQAPGMGLNSMVGTLIGGGVGAYATSALRFTFANAMLLVLISGLVFLILSVVPGGRDKETGKLKSLREYIFDGIPKSLRAAIPVGIGLFIAFLGLQNGGIIVHNSFTQVDLFAFNNYNAQIVKLGTNISDIAEMYSFMPTSAGTVVPYAAPLICLLGLLTIGVLSHFKFKAAVVVGILVATVIAIPTGVANVEVLTQGWAFWENFANFFNMDPTKGGSFAAAFTQGFDFSQIGGSAGSAVMTCIMTVVAFCMIDMFDTMGTVTGCAARAGLLDKDGKPLNFGKCMYADSIATCAGAILGTSTVTTFVESGAGVAEGGKTGMTSLTTAALFLLSIFLLPVFAFIPSAAAGSALIYVGVLMMAQVKNIDFASIKNAVPAFLTIVVMPLGYSITDGIGIGLVTYVLLDLIIYVGELIVSAVKRRELPKFDISPVTLIVTALFLVYFFVPTSF